MNPAEEMICIREACFKGLENVCFCICSKRFQLSSFAIMSQHIVRQRKIRLEHFLGLSYCRSYHNWTSVYPCNFKQWIFVSTYSDITITEIISWMNSWDNTIRFVFTKIFDILELLIIGKKCS